MSGVLYKYRCPLSYLFIYLNAATQKISRDDTKLAMKEDFIGNKTGTNSLVEGPILSPFLPAVILEQHVLSPSYWICPGSTLGICQNTQI